MLSGKTIVILGAGSSEEVGLPLGSDLIREVADALDFRDDPYAGVKGSRAVLNAIKAIADGPSRQSYVRAGLRIREALPTTTSIDSYLDRHADDAELQVVAKLGITQRILERENGSTLYEDPRSGDTFDLDSIADTWFLRFFNRMADRVSKAQVHTLFQNVSFINFNYDRCLEHFLATAIQKAYHLPVEQAQQVASTANIIHPYGKVGALPWQQSNEPKVGYGDVDCGRDTLIQVATGIRTFTEQIEDQSVLHMIRASLLAAERILFLGFGFQPQNMELLSLSQAANTKRIIATGFGLSDDARVVAHERITHMIRRQLEQRNQVENMRCSDLIAHFSFSL